MSTADRILANNQQLAQCLTKKNWTITTAESCTGGGIAQTITDLAGSSSYFSRGYVTYSNEAKADMLNVSIEDLNAFGAVSKQVVAQMAMGALRLANADLAISVSGIAGPGGGTETKPVGTVWFAFAIKNANIIDQMSEFIDRVSDPDLAACTEVNIEEHPFAMVLSVCCLLEGSRSEIRESAIDFALKQAVKVTK